MVLSHVPINTFLKDRHFIFLYSQSLSLGPYLCNKAFVIITFKLLFYIFDIYVITYYLQNF